jgi:hypothetical protein
VAMTKDVSATAHRPTSASVAAVLPIGVCI